MIVYPAVSHGGRQCRKLDDDYRCFSDAPPTHRPSRRGYTLIEMLIASVLVAALMSVVWGMMSMYNSYLTAGQTQAVEQQLIRSLLQLLEVDLQNVAIADTNPTIVPVMEDSGSDIPGASSTAAEIVDGARTDSLSETSEIFIDEPSVLAGFTAAGALMTPGGISFTGNSSSFRLSMQMLPPQDAFGSGDALMNPNDPSSTSGAAPSSDPSVLNSSTGLMGVDGMSVDGMAPEVAEHQTIIWQFQAPGVLSGTQALKPGLYRIQTESLALQTALNQQDSMPEDASTDAEGSVDQMTLEALLFPPVDSANPTAAINGEQASPLIPKFDAIPEVVSCRFEYFSGSAWTSTWNSEQQQGLPVAVRVKLRLVTPDNLIKLTQIFGEGTGGSSLLDEAMNSSAGPAASSTESKSSMPLQPGDEPGADPLTAIPTRQVERIIMLQPIVGPMPQPGTSTDLLNSDPLNDDPLTSGPGSEGGL